MKPHIIIVHWSLIQKLICRSVSRASYHYPGDGYSRGGRTYINYKQVHGCSVAGFRSWVKVEVAVLGSPSLTVLMVFRTLTFRSWVKVEVAVLGSPSLTVLMVFRTLTFRSWVKVEVAVLGSPSLTVLMFSVDVRQH